MLIWVWCGGGYIFLSYSGIYKTENQENIFGCKTNLFGTGIKMAYCNQMGESLIWDLGNLNNTMIKWQSYMTCAIGMTSCHCQTLFILEGRKGGESTASCALLSCCVTSFWGTVLIKSTDVQKFSFPTSCPHLCHLLNPVWPIPPLGYNYNMEFMSKSF